MGDVLHYLTIGVLAHVDAGKTTLSEALLYTAGALRKAGRVDLRNTLLDNDEIERTRGITIVAKQAVFTQGDIQFTLLDTPGHVDFAAETERAIPVMDYAILVLSASEGVQSHTITLWKMLQQNNVPTFVFFNKTDLASKSKQELIGEFQTHCAPQCVDFTCAENYTAFTGNLAEELALCDEILMNDFLKNNAISKENVINAIMQCALVPCFFGSALKFNGISEFLNGFTNLVKPVLYSQKFGAYVYKINSDETGARLTHLKITGGNVAVKGLLKTEQHDEKINELRLYSGAKYKTLSHAAAGMLCVATGLSHTKIGDCFGESIIQNNAKTQAVFTYKVVYSSNIPKAKMFADFKQLEEEEPALQVNYSELTGEIKVGVMGEVGLEILQTRIKQRFGHIVSFESPKIIYKETISKTTLGVGHFEPLRHYAEVYLKLQPLKQGAGLVFDTAPCKNAQDIRYMQLILTHLREKEHIGALIGAGIADIKITVLELRAHLKHTQGGDFRQATYRAVRCALRKAHSEADAVLLEPHYNYKLQIPIAQTGKAMADLQRMNATVSPPENIGENAILTGNVAVSECFEYAAEVVRYTKGLGKFTCTFAGYAPCKKQQEIVQNTAYNADADIENTADSVFCTHGAGYTVPWQEAENHMHIERQKLNNNQDYSNIKTVKQQSINASEKELMQIYERTYGQIKKREYTAPKLVKAQSESENKNKKTIYSNAADKQHFLLVDGYNIIYSWEVTKALANENLQSARKYLIDRLCNYRGVTNAHIILVFDAYRVKNGQGANETVNNINVVYTKEAETADMYIEKVTNKIAKQHIVRVATSDALEQIIILGHGALRMSAKMLLEEIENVEKNIGKLITKE